MTKPARRGRAAPAVLSRRCSAKSRGARVRSPPSHKLFGDCRCRPGSSSRWRPLSALALLSLPPGERPAAVESASGHRESAQQRGASASPPLPAQASPRLGGFSFLSLPSPTPPVSPGATRVSGGAASWSPQCARTSLCSDSYGLCRVPLASGAFAPIAGQPAAHGRVHLQVTFCKRPAQPGPACSRSASLGGPADSRAQALTSP